MDVLSFPTDPSAIHIYISATIHVTANVGQYCILQYRIVNDALNLRTVNICLL
jgi:hypothetical protein